MKLKTWHWLLLAVALTVLWLGLMVWLSHQSLRDKNPVPVAEWQKREQGR